MTGIMEIPINQWNIGHLCTKHQCDLGRGDKVALRYINDNDLLSKELTFSDLDKLSNRFANALIGQGFHQGDIIFIILPKTPELFVTFLGILKIQAIAGTLFANFGDEALLDRLTEAQCVVTKKTIVKRIRKVMPFLKRLKNLIVIDADEPLGDNILCYRDLMEEASEDYESRLTLKTTPSVLHFTSGSTGKPKGVLHVHGSIYSQRKTSEDILRLNENELYWCTADQGWITGTSYGIIGPWSLGVTQIQYSGGYDPATWFRILEKEQVTIWYTAPTALRMLMRESPDFYRQFDLSKLKYIFSVGEPLNPEILKWSRNVLGRDIFDTWFQTETGAIAIANHPGMPIRPGSMGKPVEGIKAVILNDEGNQQRMGDPGNLCMVPGWASMFVNYLNDEKNYLKKFNHGFYYSGDIAYQDDDGYFWFQGRSDDVINTAGHLVSPFEIECALLEMAEVVESGVVGVFDEILFEKVIAFVVLSKGVVWSPDLDLKIRLHITNRLSAMACPHDIRIVESLPKNKSGKIMRRVLKSTYLGEDPGDLSTQEVLP